MNRAPTSIFIPPIRREGVQSGLGIDYEDSESEHVSQESNTEEQSQESNTEEQSDESNIEEQSDESNTEEQSDESNTDEESDDDIFNSDDEDEDVDEKRKTLQKIKIGENVINLITVILPYLNEKISHARIQDSPSC